jgi:hypothetical protein
MADDPQWPFLSIHEDDSTERGRMATLDAEWRIPTTVYFPARPSPAFSLFAQMETLREFSQSTKLTFHGCAKMCPCSRPRLPISQGHRLCFFRVNTKVAFNLIGFSE